MTPGMITTAHRGGCNYQRAAFVPRQPISLNRAAPTVHTRDLGQRQRFAVSAGDGGPVITLDRDERLNIGLDEAGNVTVGIEAASENGDGAPNGSNGNGDDGAMVARRRGLINSVGSVVRRAVAAQRNKMSWEQEGGTITFEPGPDEVLSVSGDANRATVIAEPLPPSMAV